MKKFLFGIAAFVMMAVLCVVSAGAVDTELSTSGVCVAQGNVAHCITVNTTYLGGAIGLEATDTVTVTADAVNGEDTSQWSLSFESIDCNWGGWKSLVSEAGALEFTVSIQEMMDSIEVEDITKFGGFNFYVTNCQADDEIAWTISITPDESSGSADPTRNYQYTELDDGTLEITDYICSTDQLEIPSIINGKTVTSIGKQAFSDCIFLESVIIPDSVTSIGYNAFYNCTSLTSINIPDSVTSIGEKAFFATALLNNQTSDVKYADTWVIDCDENAETVTIKNGTKGIADWAFSDCSSLTSITIPESVTAIGKAAFSDCESLTAITIPDGVTTLKSTFEGCESLASINIPDSITSMSGTFYNCKSLTSITIPDSVTDIGTYTFTGCEFLTSINIPKDITNIGQGVFSGCMRLTSITIPDGVTSIGDWAFYDCRSLTSITIPDGVTSIGEWTFCGCRSLTSITIPDGITNIGQYTFNYCTSLTSITIPDSVTSIGNDAFSSCDSLTSITIPDSVTNIGNSAFTGCNSLVISCYRNSYAHTYAIDNGIAYKLFVPAVSNFALKSRNYNSITLSWGENSEASGYILQQYKNNDWTNIANIKDSTVTSYQISNLAADTSYKFRAVAYVTDGENTSYSSYTSALTVSTAPAMTTGFAITGRGSDYLTITWTKNTGASGYIIQEQVDGVWKNVASIKGNTTVSYKISGLQPNSFHRYRMVAYKTDANGTCYGKYTGSAPGYTAPAMVSGFKVSASTSDSLTVSWDKLASANGYVIDIYRDGKWSQLVKIASNATTSYKTTGLNIGTTYKFRIKSYATNGTLTIYSTYSSAISGVPALSAPTNLKMTNKGADFISVRWDKNADANGYMVYIYDGTGWKCVKTLTTASSVSHKITELVSGKAYKVTVKAYKTVNGTKYISDTVTISANTL